MFEKSDTELKLVQNLLKCKCNVRTLNRIGQLPELTASAVDPTKDIVCVQKHRYTHSEYNKYHDTGNGWKLATAFAWKNSDKATIGGVGMLIGLQALKSLNSMEKIQPRMIVATFNGNPSATTISCYRLTNDSEETDLIALYNELSSLVRSIPRHNVLVISEDTNAQIGKNVNHKLHMSSRNGKHLTDFMLENRLTCSNTKFQ